MEFNLTTRREIIAKEAQKYDKARKKEKKQIMDRLVVMLGYNRSYLSWLLRNFGRKVHVKWHNKRIILIAAVRKCTNQGKKRGRLYGSEVQEALKAIWGIMNFACGKRLQAVMKQMVNKLEEKGEMIVGEEIKSKLTTMSSATIDRLLKSERKDLYLKRRGGTKPGSMLKNQIPIRTFTEWDEQKPGFIEIDLVAHDGGNGRGEYNQTLNCTDIATGWTDQQAIHNKAQIWVFNALKDIEARLPFMLLGIDSDNGSEFINNHLLRYCQDKHISFTRSRPYRKNDNCFIEQKNWTAVRKTVGYYRFDNEKTVRLLNKLYRCLSLYNNYFQPTMKLIQKTRIGSKVKKKYDTPKTPYQRLLQSPSLSQQEKQELTLIYEELNPAELLRNIEHIKRSLVRLASRDNNVILTNNEVSSCTTKR